ncbi:MAG: peptide MFS transporter [Bacteroidia bacterium]
MKESKHPKGLPYLFFAEMWERFGFYLMIGIFTLYLTNNIESGGWGMERIDAFDIYGTFIALVFLSPFIGGLLADRILGYRLSIIIGGVMMGIGYCLLAIHELTVFYIALFLIILGNGFFKPNISTLLGNLYNDKKYIGLKDAGYNIFYMGINIGALICNFFAASLRNNFGWGAAFIAAGVGMFIGVIVFVIGMKNYTHVDVLKPVKKEDASLTRIFGSTIVPAVVVGIVGWFIPGTIFGSDSTDAFIFGSMPIVYFYFSLWKNASIEDKKPISAMLAIFGVVIVFWAVFKQNGTALTTWAEKYTDREVTALIATPVKVLSFSNTINYTQQLVVKTDHQFRKIKDANGEPIKEMGYSDYFKNVKAENLPEKGAQINIMNTELFQSINPFWVVTLTPLIVLFFGFLKKRGKEPTTPVKIAWGLVISALSTFVMIAAVYISNNGAIKASPWWLIASYGVITVGELLLSPMGLSLVSKLSPPRLTALMMGGWFLATALGNKLSGVLATLWDNYENKEYFFLLNFILLSLAAIAIFMMLKWLNKIFKEHIIR